MARLTRDELIERVAQALFEVRGLPMSIMAQAAIETYEELTTADAYGAEARNRLLQGLHGSAAVIDTITDRTSGGTT